MGSATRKRGGGRREWSAQPHFRVRRVRQPTILEVLEEGARPGTAQVAREGALLALGYDENTVDDAIRRQIAGDARNDLVTMLYRWMAMRAAR